MMDDAEILNALCNEPMVIDETGTKLTTIRCTEPFGHDQGPDPTLHHDEHTGLSWGPLSAVDAIVEP